MQFQGLWIFNLCKFLPSENAKNHEKLKFKASKFVKMADFALLESPILISRKIWVIEKSWNFHTVLLECSVSVQIVLNSNGFVNSRFQKLPNWKLVYSVFSKHL